MEIVLEENGRTFLAPGYDGPTPVVVNYDKYTTTSALAVSLYEKLQFFDGDTDGLIVEPEPYEELFAVVTVNLPESASLPWGTQFVDINNYPWSYNWLIDNKLAEPTEYSARSGFCEYPAMKFFLEC